MSRQRAAAFNAAAPVYMKKQSVNFTHFSGEYPVTACGDKVIFEYLKELKSEYYSKKKKYILIEIPCTALFVVGLITLILTGKGYFLWSEYHSFVFLGFSVSIFGFVYSLGLMEAYELLVENERFSKNLFFRLRKRLREKLIRH